MIIKVRCDFPRGLLRFATRDIQDEDGNWQNKIISISSLNRNIGEDKSYEVSGITVEFNDTDRYFRGMMAGSQRFIAGGKVELLSETDQLIYTGVVEKWVFKEDAFELHINDRLSGLDAVVPETFTPDNFPGLAEQADGQSIPIIYGSLFEETGAVKCWQVEAGKYLLAGHHCKAITGNVVDLGDGSYSASVYDEDENEITGACLENNADGYAYINCSSSDEFIYANVDGKIDADGTLLEDPVDVITNLIDDHSNMNYDSQAMADARQVTRAREYLFAGVIADHKSLKEVLKEFCFSFDCDFYIGKGSEIMITLLQWSALLPVKCYSQAQIVEFEIEESPEEIRNKVKYRYRFDNINNEYRHEPEFFKESSIMNWGEFYNKNETLELRYVTRDDVAFDVVQRYVIQRKNPGRMAQISIPLSEFLGVEIADVIEISHPGAIDDSGRKYQVRRVDIDFIMELVRVEASDITTLTGGVFILGGREDAKLKSKWDDDDNYSRDYGYLSDRQDGFFMNDIDYGKVLY